MRSRSSRSGGRRALRRIKSLPRIGSAAKWTARIQPVRTPRQRSMTAKATRSMPPASAAETRRGEARRHADQRLPVSSIPAELFSGQAQAAVGARVGQDTPRRLKAADDGNLLVGTGVDYEDVV